MSKYKYPSVMINAINTVGNGSYTITFGLGSDNKMYRWDDSKGKWIKDWKWSEDE